jgi:hypothetical protein
MKSSGQFSAKIRKDFQGCEQTNEKGSHDQRCGRACRPKPTFCWDRFDEKVTFAVMVAAGALRLCGWTRRYEPLQHSSA